MSDGRAISVLARSTLTRRWRDGDDPVRALSTLGVLPSEDRVGDWELEVLHSCLTPRALWNRV